MTAPAFIQEADFSLLLRSPRGFSATGIIKATKCLVGRTAVEFVDLILMKVDAAPFAGTQAHPVSYILCKPCTQYYVMDGRIAL